MDTRDILGWGRMRRMKQGREQGPLTAGSSAIRHRPKISVHIGPGSFARPHCWLRPRRNKAVLSGWLGVACVAVILAAGVACSRRSQRSSTPSPSSNPASSAGVAGTSARSAPQAVLEQESASPPYDSGPLIEAKPPLLDRAILVRACDSAGFCEVQPLPIGVNLNAVWPFEPHDVWVVGDGGVALHFDGRAFRQVETATWDDLVAIWANSADDLWVLGSTGTLLHWNGRRFEIIWHPASFLKYYETPNVPRAIDRLQPLAGHPAARAKLPVELADEKEPTVVLRDIWGTTDGQLWIAGGITGRRRERELVPEEFALVRHFDGSAWHSEVGKVPSALTALWGTSANDLWALSDDLRASHWQGQDWSTARAALTPDAFSQLHLHAPNWVPERYGVQPPAYAGVWQQRAEDSWVIRNQDGHEVVERFDFRRDELVAGSGNARLTFERGTLRDIRGSSASDVWLVGSTGLLLHFDGVRWRGLKTKPLPPRDNVSAAWVVEPSEVWAVGVRGVVLRWDGQVLNDMPRPSSDDLLAVWGERSDEIWAVGRGGPFVWNGSSWKSVDVGSNKHGLIRVSGVGAEVWATGFEHDVYRGDASGLQPVQFPSDPGLQPYVLVRSADDVLIVGNGLFHWDGQRISRVTEGALAEYVQGHKTYQLYAAPPASPVMFGLRGGLVSRIDDEQVTATASTSDFYLTACAAPDGSFYAASGAHILAWKGDGPFRAYVAHVPSGLLAVACGAHEVWTFGYNGIISKLTLANSPRPDGGVRPLP